MVSCLLQGKGKRRRRGDWQGKKDRTPSSWGTEELGTGWRSAWDAFSARGAASSGLGKCRITSRANHDVNPEQTRQGFTRVSPSSLGPTGPEQHHG